MAYPEGLLFAAGIPPTDRYIWAAGYYSYRGFTADDKDYRDPINLLQNVNQCFSIEI